MKAKEKFKVGDIVKLKLAYPLGNEIRQDTENI